MDNLAGVIGIDATALGLANWGSADPRRELL